MCHTHVQHARHKLERFASILLFAVVVLMLLSLTACNRPPQPGKVVVAPGVVSTPKEPEPLDPAEEASLASPLPAADEPPPPRPVPARVAVVAPLHADQADPDSKRLAETITDVLAIALADQRDMRVVERAKLAELLQEQKLSLSGLVDPATAARVGKLLAAEVVVAGTLIESQAKLRGAILVVAVDGQRVLGNVELDSSPDALVTDLVTASTRVAGLAGVKLPAVKEADLDDSPVGRLHLMRGVGYYHARNADQAIVSCLRAVQLDPRLQEARLWIARGYLQLGDPSHARAELTRLANNPAGKQFANEIQQLLDECKTKK